MLIAMAGLPGAGKSAVADAVGRALDATVLSVDPVEAAMWRAGVGRDQPTGIAAYVVVEAVARHQLALGRTVVVDAVDAVDEARGQWRDLARTAGVPLHFVEVGCSDTALHRRRLEGRRRDIEGFAEPTWESVQQVRREYAPWVDAPLRVDSVRPLDEVVAAVLGHVRPGERTSVVR
ncbi:AAA family ATPase [Cellulomonas cellasea]|uniref:Putative kinase n=1 Tax=Cellulomonas cellasea TaxID=43670 RepID=A0A7W4UFK4_9CELL|nr:AAA family ATPase [Cellulomonas cellasea]MBB2923265.1 putative kinase [Cellulomonas cellasea]